MDDHLPMIDEVVDRNMKEHDPAERAQYLKSMKKVYTLAVDTTLKALDRQHQNREINLNR